MKCPIDNVDLQMTERSGIEIDYCPTCRGVWLDRGELDKILDRVAGQPAAAAPPPPPPQPQYQQPPPQQHYEHTPHGSWDERRDRGYDPRYDKKRKRKSFLDDLFDFD